MIVSVKRTPTNEDLIALLRQKLPSEYSVKEFGLGKKTVLIKKSTFIGAQITVRENEISIDASAPSVAGGMWSTLAMTELAIVIVPVFWIAGAFPSKMKKFEKEVANFINERYN
jgi:hypothetical protein